MATFTVVYDACLFYPAPLRDLMIRLAQTRRFRARWSEAIQREWLTALLHNRPELDEAKLARTMTLMNQAVPDLANLEPAVVTAAAKLQRAALKEPPLSPDAFVSKLRQQGLPGVAAFLQDEIALI